MPVARSALGVGRGSFSTVQPLFISFAGTENPISQNNTFIHNNSTWKKPQVISGVACNSVVQSNYDDAYAYVSPTYLFGNNYEVEATIFRTGGYAPVNGHEVEIILRMTEIGGTDVLAVECLLGISSTGPYCQIMRWQGTEGPSYFTPIDDGSGSAIDPSTGDKFRARVQGTTVTCGLVVGGSYTQMKIATAGVTPTTGQPGMSFYTNTGGTLGNYGLSDYRVTPL